MSSFRRSIPLIVIGFFLPGFLAAQQDSGFSLLGEEAPERVKVENAFKTTRVINIQSMELTDAGVMDVKINHRFGAVGLGAYEAFGLDNASVRIGAEYGIVPNLALILGRSSLNRMVDAGLKYRIMHQTNDNHRPVSLLVYVGAARSAVPISTNKIMDYTGQLIIGRKISDGFSIQLSPSYVSMGRGGETGALGIAMRQKITKRTTFNLEYIPAIVRPMGRAVYRNSLSVGVDIETGGHVFQLHFTNSSGMAEPQFIAYNTDTWSNQGFRFGFNISRVFTVVDPGKFSR
jgi:hypothetical protein